MNFYVLTMFLKCSFLNNLAHHRNSLWTWQVLKMFCICLWKETCTKTQVHMNSALWQNGSYLHQRNDVVFKAQCGHVTNKIKITQTYRMNGMENNILWARSDSARPVHKNNCHNRQIQLNRRHPINDFFFFLITFII